MGLSGCWKQADQVDSTISKNPVVLAKPDATVIEPPTSTRSQPIAPADAELEAAIRATAPDYTIEVVSEPVMKSRYTVVRTDLNGDGKNEVFVYLMGGFFCGSGGCNLLVFSQGMDGYSLLANISTSDPPIIVADTQSNGYSDFWRMQSVGAGSSEYVQHIYQDGKYIEKSRMPASNSPMGKKILPADTDFASGIELEPRK
ncbi:MAG: hypothetical protein KA902_02055 [Arenimonas sp.]|nr:hypothetical protein [Arenimonas sp.]